MRRALAALLVAAVVATSLGGCATRTQTGAFVGGGAGAVLGGVLGGLFGPKKDREKAIAIGAGVGAVLGAAIGGAVGRYLDQRIGDRAQAVKQLDYVPSQGNVIQVERSEVVPVPARPGQKIVVRMEYYVVAPIPDLRVDLRVWCEIKHDDGSVMERLSDKIRMEQGMYTSTYEFQLPPDTRPGKYTILTTFRTEGGNHQTAQATLIVQ